MEGGVGKEEGIELILDVFNLKLQYWYEKLILWAFGNVLEVIQ